MRRPIEVFGRTNEWGITLGSAVIWMCISGLFGLKSMSVRRIKTYMLTGSMFGIGIGRGIVDGNLPFKEKNF